MRIVDEEGLRTHLSSSAKTNPLQGVGRNSVNRHEELAEQGNVVILELPKVGVVDIGGKEGVGNIMANRGHGLDELLDGLQKVQGNEADSRILPKRLSRGPPGGDDNLRPLGRRLSNEVFDDGISSDAVCSSDKGNLCARVSHCMFGG